MIPPEFYADLEICPNQTPIRKRKGGIHINQSMANKIGNSLKIKYKKPTFDQQ
jgi:hypothetical protein